MKNSKYLKGALYSDIHLGHRRTKTQHIIETLEDTFPDTVETAKLDVIFMAGDYYDRLLTTNSEDYIAIFTYTTRFLRMCKRMGIVVRFLEGTPSHDYNQCKIFEEANQHIGADFKLASVLSYEHIESLGLDVIYIPDEWSADNEDTKQQVIDLMKRNNLEQVDFVIMHGIFDHQLPPHVIVNIHDFDFYDRIVRYNAYCGHVHQFSERGRVLVPGSLERLSHGDEGAKGHVRFEINGDEISNRFIVNPRAQIYKKIELKSEDYETDEALYRGIVDIATQMVEDKSLVLGSHGRFTIDEKRDLAEAMGMLNDKYPGVVWDSRSNVNNTEDFVKVNEIVDKDKPKLIITKDNIVGLTMEILNEFESDPELVEQATEMLGGILNEG